MNNSVFLVHGRDHTAKNELVKLLSSVGTPVVSWSRARELTGRPNPSVLDIVATGMRQSAATVVLLTGDEISQLLPSLGSESPRRQPRPNVILELGWALAIQPDSTVIIKIGESELMSDVAGLHVPTLTNASQARKDFIKRLESAGCEIDWTSDTWMSPDLAGDFEAPFPSLEGLVPETSVLSEEPAETPTKATSMFTPYLVDTALSLELSHDNLFEEVRRRIRDSQDLDLKYHYVGPQMSAYWKEVARDPEYGHELLEHLNEANLPEIVEASGLRGSSCSLISLGPGDGRIDAAFLRQLVRVISDVRYHLVDISVDLLQMAVQAVQADQGLADVPVRAYLADFEKSLGTISLFMREDQRRVLFLLTGFTLGNSREDVLLSAIENAMIESDCLLLDARLHQQGVLRGRKVTDLPKWVIDDLMHAYSSPAVRKFAFGPIEVATDFAIDPLENSDRIAFGTEPKLGYSAVPDAISVFLTCQGLYHKRFGKFNRRVGLNDMQVLARGRRRISLAQVTFYDFQALKDWLGQRFHVKWSLNADNVGLFLVQR